MTVRASTDPAAGIRVRTRDLDLVVDAGLSREDGSSPPDAPRRGRIAFLEGHPPPWIAGDDRENLLAFTGGLYPPDPGGATWMGRTAAFLLGPVPGAARLEIHALVPGTLLRHGPARLRVRVASFDPGPVEIRREGPVRLEVLLPPRLTTGASPGPVPVLVEWERGFRPADEGTGGDVRLLTAVFRGCGFVDAIGLPWRSSRPPAPAGPLPRHLPALHGRCTVCGSPETLLVTPGSGLEENLRCSSCGSFARWRMLARSLLLFLLQRGWDADSIAGLRGARPGNPVRVLDTCSSWPPARLLRGVPGIDLFVSEYDPEAAPGSELAPGVRCENLENLAFPEASLDLVLTSDVLEHVRLYRRALTEVFRVLRPGGEFLFTVPHLREADGHEVYREVIDPGDPSRDRDLSGPVYHDDTRGGGSLVYRVYALDRLLEELRGLGFLVAYERRTIPGLALPDQALFRAVKPVYPVRPEVAP